MEQSKQFQELKNQTGFLNDSLVKLTSKVDSIATHTRMLETQISQVAQQVATSSQTPEVFPSQTEANPKGLINAIQLRDGKQLEDPIMKTKTIEGEIESEKQQESQVDATIPLGTIGYWVEKPSNRQANDSKRALRGRQPTYLSKYDAKKSKASKRKGEDIEASGRGASKKQSTARNHGIQFNDSEQRNRYPDVNALDRLEIDEHVIRLLNKFTILCFGTFTRLWLAPYGVEKR
ncbi:hypothetical protein MTR_7g029380 [Medicago truncatula]|uniref:Uncharacterized protein n=1 Tax=Medicago truncatula TaxID=3880 RepID=A0A072U866_MEDTR|nr:hypothetical protein MTR_7g029380 [Medicago truncatula]